jgi:DNA-binding FrmR family transcriptional regulator
MTAAEQLKSHDKQIAAIRTLVHEGMKLVVETRKDMCLMLQSQKRTEKNLADLIVALGRSSNGKH